MSFEQWAPFYRARFFMLFNRHRRAIQELESALLSDTVDSTDALVFLGGTNIGAAVYEYGVARLSWTFLDRRLGRGGPHPPPSQRAPHRDSAPLDA